MATDVAADGWIGGRRFDLVFFFGSSVIALAAGALAIAWRPLAAFLWWGWLLLVDGPHLAATWQRTYLDPRERARRARLLTFSFAWVLLGPVVLLVSVAFDDPRPFLGFLVFAIAWSWHHAVRQHYGIMAIYARHARTSPASRRVDTIFLHTTMWGLYALFLFAYPDNRVLLELPQELPDWGRWLIGLAYGAIVLEFLAYGAYLLVRKHRGESLKPALFVLVQAFGIATFAYFIVGAFEPLHPHPVTFEQHILAVAFVVGIVHGLQYLGIIIAVSRRRYAAAGEGIAARMGRRPLVAYALLVAASVGYLALNAARGDGPGVAWFSTDTNLAKAFLAVYWGIFLHHFYLDQKIWHPHRDAELRVELGLESR